MAALDNQDLKAYITKMLNGIFFIARNGKSRSGERSKPMKIFIDAGHGGKDPGAVGNGLYEKDIALAVSLQLKTLLEKYGIETRLSRSTDTYLTINERYQLANAWGADYFISIHTNAGGGTGAETLYYKADSKAYAQTLQSAFINAMGLRNRGVKYRDDLGVIKWTNMPAALIELAFIDTEADAVILNYNQDEIAHAIARGFLNLLGIDIITNLEESEEMSIRYNTIDELPLWAKSTVEKLVKKNILQGTEKGLELSEDMLRILVINDRAGIYK